MATPSHKKISLAISGLLLCSPLVTSAAAEPINFTEVINRLIDRVVWPIFLGLVIIMFIYAGVLFLTARGEPERITKARKAIIWATVGIVVAFVAFSAQCIISGILGIQCGNVFGMFF